VRAASASLFVRGGLRASVSLNSNDPWGNKAPPPLAPAEHLSESRPARWPTRSCCQRASTAPPNVRWARPTEPYFQGDYRFLLVSTSRPKYFRIRVHVHASVVVCSNSRCCRLPIENGIAVCATGYWRLVARRGTALRQRQRSSTDEQRDDRKCFHAGHFYLQCLAALTLVQNRKPRCRRQVDVSTSDPRAAVVDANRDASAVANAYLGAEWQPAMGSCHCCTI
jgi:hypothetical protein